jgi:hypothetical protein
MIIRAIVLGIEEDKFEDLRAIYAFDNSDEFFQQYTSWDDARLMLTFDARARPGTLCGGLFARLQNRELLKQVYSERLQDLPEPNIRERLLAISKPENDTLRKKIEEAVAQLLTEHLKVDVDPRLVILHGFNIQSVRTTSRNDEASIMIDAPGQPQPFEDYSALFQSIKEGYADGSVEVYAPIEWDTRSDRRQIRDKLRDPIRETIESVTKGTLEEEVKQ